MRTAPSFQRSKFRKPAWDFIQELDEFRPEDIVAGIGIGITSARNWVRQWESEGYIRVVRSVGRKRFYRVSKKKTEVPPSFRADMSAVPSQTAHGNMWRAMRMMRQFSPTDLAIHSTTDVVDVSGQAAKEYCRMLTRAGYLRVIEKALPGRREPRYRLVKNTGPRPPREKRVRAVFDENLDEFTHVAGGLQ